MKLYTQIIQDLYEEIGISKDDTKSLVDVALSSVDIKKVNYEWTEEISKYRDNLFKDYGELF